MSILTVVILIFSACCAGLGGYWLLQLPKLLEIHKKAMEFHDRESRKK